VVVSDAVGPKSILDGSGGGEMVPRRDAEALSRALARILDDPAAARQAGERGQEHVRRHYTKRRVVEQVTAIYDAVLGDR
jgi:glycosyltransferase involved in cell wall biosynthesis